MNRAAVLLGLVLLVAPATPTVASSHSSGDGSDASTRSFGGDHLSLSTDPDLPGVRDVALSASGALLLEEIQLPGTFQEQEIRDDEVRFDTDVAELRAEDGPELEIQLDVDGTASSTLVVADGVSIEENRTSSIVRYRLTPSGGPTLVVTAAEASLDGSTITVTGDLVTHASREDASSGDDGDAPDGDDDTGGQTDDNGSAPAPSNRSDERDGNASRGQDRAGDGGAPDDRPGGDDRPAADDRRDDASRTRASDGPYRVGPASFTLARDQLENVTVRETTILASLKIPGLEPAEERRKGAQLELRGDEARLRLQADGGLLLRAESQMRITGRIADGIDVRQEDDQAFLQADALVVIVQGDDLRVDDGRLVTSGELRLSARTQERPEQAVWERHQDEDVGLPLVHEGRYVGFTLNETGLSNLSIHGTPVGSITFDTAHVDEIEERGSRLSAEGDGFELHVIDAPATRIGIEASILSTDVPSSTTLPSGAKLVVQQEGDELVLHVTQPQGVVANETAFEHRPSDVPVEETEGPELGLRARTQGGELGVRSRTPGSVAASFQGRLNGTEGNVSLELGLTRAMLIDDVNGNSRLDIGEPAIAQRALANGTTSIEGDTLVNRFQLWSGNLTVNVQPGNETAKVTYVVENLSAPPGTLFVLETRAQAPPGARLTPTDDGVLVRNGSMQVRYSAAGPVTVDGADAWADRSIFVDSNDTVRILLAYPAGDDIVHDPTLAIQSVPGAQAIGRLAASPWAVVGGVLAATLLVGVTAWKRRRGPRV